MVLCPVTCLLSEPISHLFQTPFHIFHMVRDALIFIYMSRFRIPHDDYQIPERTRMERQCYQGPDQDGSLISSGPLVEECSSWRQTPSVGRKMRVLTFHQGVIVTIVKWVFPYKVNGNYLHLSGIRFHKYTTLLSLLNFDIMYSSRALLLALLSLAGKATATPPGCDGNRYVFISSLPLEIPH